MPKLANAACIGTEASVAVCKRCWDRPECLAWALESEKDGFWGGYSMRSRTNMRAQFGIPEPEGR